MSEWIKACKENSLKNGDLLDFDFGDKNILIAKAGDKIYATDRICTHAYADLSTGFMNENEKNRHMSSTHVCFQIRRWYSSKSPCRRASKNLQCKNTRQLGLYLNGVNY